MKKSLFIVLFVVFCALFLNAPSVEASKKVHGYYKKNGTYVDSYYRSDSDSNKYNNYSSKGNTNPYTGKKGYVNYKKSR